MLLFHKNIYREKKTSETTATDKTHQRQSVDAEWTSFTRCEMSFLKACQRVMS